METRMLGSLWPVSVLTIGGGGIGQVWGSTNRSESVATLREAVDSGITLVDVAPSYGDGEAETVLGDAFHGSLPAGLRIGTKHHVGNAPASEIGEAMQRSLEQSLARMKVDFVDLFFLHSPIVADDSQGTDTRTPLALFREVARPALENLVERGLVGAWGITGAHPPSTVIPVLGEEPSPAAVQVVANALNSPGDMAWSDEPPRLRDLIASAVTRGTGVMGIRALQAGALTNAIDRELPGDHWVAADFERAAPFRALAAEMGETPASLAYRYALSVEGVDTVVLGVKNRTELKEALESERSGVLSAEEVALIDGLKL